MKVRIFIISFFICSAVFSQNITNTLGSSGVFKIKDGTTDFFTLNQLNGSIELNSGQPGNIRGSILKGGIQFLHTYYGIGTDGANTFLGLRAGNFAIGGVGGEGSYNTGVGYQSLNSLTAGKSNSAFGYSTLFKNTTGSFNSSFGFGVLNNNTTGNYNTAFGTYSMFSSIDGYENSAFGNNSLFLNRTGWQNTAVGFDALRNNIVGFQNTAVGHHSLQNNTGNYNTAIGYNSGSTVTTGNNLTLIGIDANPSAPNALNEITLGNIFVTSLRCAVTTITSLSDRRDKKNIEDLTLGLDFINKLKPRQFNWDRREWYDNGISDGSKINETPTAGFIAQELDSAQTDAGAEWLNLVLKDNPEKWEATPGNLFPIVIKAIQELKAENDMLKEKLDKYEQTQNMLVVEIEKLKSKETQNKEVNLSGK